MTKIYSFPDFTRKMTAVKGDLYSDAFYSTPIIARVKVVSGASGIYNRNVKTTYIDTIVSGIAEYGPHFINFEEGAETIDGDVRFTCRVVDKATIDAADELWLRVCITNGVIQYTSVSKAQFTTGTMYKVNSSKPSIFSLDEIYILKLGGKLS